MARFAYLADLLDGETLEWRDHREPTYVDRMGCQRYREVSARVSLCIPTTEPFCNGNVLCGYLPGKGWIRISRKVELKSNPTRHDCDSRCMNASGRNMACECSCNGRNHGKGRVSFSCGAA